MGTTAQKLAALAEVKADIADAITAKGGTVPTKFADYATAISNLPNNKLPSVVDQTVITLSASDLAGATKIAFGVFQNCASLTSIGVPDSVTSIERYAFSNCSSLATIDFGTTRSTIPTLVDSNAFTGLPNDYQVLVPSALLTTWQAASGWSDISSHIVAHP